MLLRRIVFYLGLITFLTVRSLPVLALEIPPEKICESLLNIISEPSLATLGSKLKTAGYSSFIIQRLLTEQPTFLKELAQFSEDDLKPVTFYRGLAVRPSSYNRSFLSEKHEKYTYITSLFSTARLFGFASGDPEWPGGVLLELTIPFGWARIYGGQKVVDGKVYGPDNIGLPPDHNPEFFITRFGIYDLPRALVDKQNYDRDQKDEKGYYRYPFDSPLFRFEPGDYLEKPTQYVQWYLYGDLFNNSDFLKKFKGVQAGAPVQ